MTTKRASQQNPVRLRALVFGAGLVVLADFWLMAAANWGSAYPTTVSLFHHVIFILFVLVGLNAAIRRIPGLRHRPLFTTGELVVLYVMLSVGSAIAGLDLVQTFGTFPLGVKALATPENDWQALFFRFIPDWLVVNDPVTLRALQEGESTLYVARHIRAVLTPLFVWSAFLFVLTAVMLCLTLIVRERWVEGEKLSYPIIQLPLHMTVRSSSFFRSKALWLGFAASGSINLLNGMNFLYPNVPSLGGKLHDLSPLFPNPPWNAIGWTPIAFFPYAAGLAFFMPLDLSFSAWFFYLFWKMELVFGKALGVRGLPDFPYVEPQTAGAYIGLCFLAIWATRSHIAAIFRGDSRVDYRTPRWAFLGVLVGLALLIGFSLVLKMSLWVAVLFFLGYFVVSIGITRMRAELGSPVHDLHRAGPHLMMVKVFGTRALSPADMTLFSFYQGFNRAYRSHPMPHQLEGFKLIEQAKSSRNRLIVAIFVTALVAPPASFWALTHFSFKYGIPNIGKVPESFGRLAGWLSASTGPDIGAAIAIGFGFATTLVFAVLRARFIWFPLHPAGYAVSSSWSINLFWFSIFVSWAIKLGVLRFGGLPLLRKVQPFFLGVILGDFVIGSLWMLRGTVLGVPTYKFLF